MHETVSGSLARDLPVSLEQANSFKVIKAVSQNFYFRFQCLRLQFHYKKQTLFKAVTQTFNPVVKSK